MAAERKTSKDKYYDVSLHGPVREISLNRRYCVVGGGLILCPSLSKDKRKCNLYGKLERGAMFTVVGIDCYRTSIHVPFRLAKCIEGKRYIEIRNRGATKPLKVKVKKKPGK